MGELVSRSATTGVGRWTPPDLASSKRPEDTKWSGGGSVDFDDLGANVPPAPSIVVASAARLEDKARRRRTGEYARRRWGWRADRTGYDLVVQEQRLFARPDGRFSPLGDWRTLSVDRVNAVEVSRRAGDVAGDPLAASGPTDGADKGRPGQPAMHRDLGYLPTAVRLSLVQAVPDPVFEGVLALQWSTHDNHVLRHTVSALRHNGTKAAVVVGSRQQGARTWQVEQVNYILLSTSPGAAPLDGAPHSRSVGRA